MMANSQPHGILTKQMSNPDPRGLGDLPDRSQSSGPLFAIPKPGPLPKFLVRPNMEDTVLDVNQRDLSHLGDNTAAAVSCQNSMASPFLRLPSELRNELYKAILGDRLIHVRHPMGAPTCKPWRHVVCQRGNPKHFRAEQHRSLTGPRLSDDWEPQHRLCKHETYYNPTMEESDDYWETERMHLPILRCCRQMYIEANQILWSTNTFSMHDLDTMRDFMDDRSADQKSLIRALRLRFDLVRGFLNHRRSVLTLDFISALPGIRHLDLVLEDAFDARLVQLRAMTGRSLTETGGNRMDAGLSMLSLLPLKSVDVTVLTSQTSDSENNSTVEAWRKEYAENIRRYILGRQGGLDGRYISF